jgi:NADH dehydrogenase
MNVAIAGGTGFIGKVIIKKLVERGHHVIALVRPGSVLKINKFPGTETRYIYYDSPGQISKTLDGGEAIINLVGIIRETKNITFDFAHHTVSQLLSKGAREAGIRRFLQMSALGVGRNIATGYFESKEAGEKSLKNTPDLDWTIFRPSIVFGPEDSFVNMFASMIRKAPFVPVIGDGQYRMQPVWVEDVAEGFAKCLEMPQTIGKTYDIGGPEKIPFEQVLDIIGKAMGKRNVRKIHLPVGLMRTLAKYFGKLSFFPVTSDQIMMLLAESTTDDLSYFKELEITPRLFAEGISEYIKPSKKP